MQTNEITSTAGHHALATGVTTGISKRSDSGSSGKLTGANDEFEIQDVDLKYKSQPAPIELDNTVEKLQEYSSLAKFNIGFGRDERTNTMIIEIIDSDTGEITNQIPADKILTLKEHMRDILGAVFDYLA